MSQMSEQQPGGERVAPTAERADDRSGGRVGGRLGGVAARLTAELVIGLSLAAVLLLVAWTSSTAIKFVYGGY